MTENPEDGLNFSKREIEIATRSAVRDILLGKEGQDLMAHVAEITAEHTITDFMLKIGMDTTTPAAVIALQEDMRHLRWWNGVVASTSTKIMIVLSMVVVGGWPWAFSIIRAIMLNEFSK